MKKNDKNDKTKQENNINKVYYGYGARLCFNGVIFLVCFACGLLFLMKSFDFIEQENIKQSDTITKEKLEVLKKHNVNRVSINPQTFNNSVLNEIGRQHTSEETVEKYKLAREVGFDVINMDLIAGLPTDTIDGFKNSVEKALSLNPENITVHTLSLKRSSTIVTEDEKGGLDATITSNMVEYANSRLTECGYKPYYMYRQSKSLGNLENVGWCKENKECYYNVYMMSECQTVLSVGAGSVTKLKEPRGSQIERIFNFKFPFEYISRFDELIERKNRINTFFKEYPIREV